jgi:ketosteroid isomerase-like protein
MPDWPDPARARGRDAMWSTWRVALSAWENLRAEPRDFIETGRHVVVLNRVRARGKGSGAEVTADSATVWTMDAGKAIRLAVYWDSTKALGAVGLSE